MRTTASLTSLSVSGTDQTGQSCSRLIPMTSPLHIVYPAVINRSEWTSRNEYFKLWVQYTKSFVHVNISSAIVMDIFQGVVDKGFDILYMGLV